MAANAKLSSKDFGNFVENKKARLASYTKKTFICNDGEGSFVPGQLIVKFKATLSEDESSNQEQKYRTLKNRTISLKKLLNEPASSFSTPPGQQTKTLKLKQDIGLDRLYLMTIEDKYQSYRQTRTITKDDCLELMDTMKELMQDVDIEYAEPNFIYKSMATVNDPLVSSGYTGTWWINKIELEDAWNVGHGEGVTVAVIDSGVDWGHPDLASNIPYVGYDYASGDKYPEDGTGHGTHVAGTIAAVGNNSRGVVGVAYKAKIFPIKVLNEFGAGTSTYTSDLVNALSNALSNNVSVVNLSIVTTEYSYILDQTCESLYQAGIVIVAASGNGGDDAIGDNELLYPAGYASVMAVAATNQSDKLSDFSNYGDWVDVAAPGEDILSTFSNNALLVCRDNCLDNVIYFDNSTYGYALSDGTSMAAPVVSGLAALLKGYSSELTSDDIYTIISLTTDSINGSHSILNGRVNALSALGFALEVKAGRAVDRDQDFNISDDELLDYAWNLYRTGKYYFEFFDINNNGANDRGDLVLINENVIQTLEQSSQDAFLQYFAIIGAVDTRKDGVITKAERQNFRKKINSFIRRGKYFSPYDATGDGLLNSSDLLLIVSTFGRLGITI